MIFTWQKSPFIIRQIAQEEKKVFVTFDDGPDPIMTPQVLDLLAKLDVHASFSRTRGRPLQPDLRWR